MVPWILGHVSSRSPDNGIRLAWGATNDYVNLFFADSFIYAIYYIISCNVMLNDFFIRIGIAIIHHSSS